MKAPILCHSLLGWEFAPKARLQTGSTVKQLVQHHNGWSWQVLSTASNARCRWQWRSTRSCEIHWALMGAWRVPSRCPRLGRWHSLAGANALVCTWVPRAMLKIAENASLLLGILGSSINCWGLKQITSYRESFEIARQARGNALFGAWAGAGGLWVLWSEIRQMTDFCQMASLSAERSEVRNFSWNLTFFEWKRLLHNAVDKTPENAPDWFKSHLDWLRSLRPRENVRWFLDVPCKSRNHLERFGEEEPSQCLDFRGGHSWYLCCTFFVHLDVKVTWSKVGYVWGTYLTFFNMAGDNIKTKMQVEPERYPSFLSTAREIWSQHGLLGFTRGSFFKGVYLILGSTLAIGIQERLTEIMAALLRWNMPVPLCFFTTKWRM